MVQERIFLGILIGLVSYSSLYIGKGIQKNAVDGIKEAKSLKTKHSGIWIAGTILTALPVFFQWAALLFAPIKLIAPLEGIGLIVLLLFSYRFLHEKITPVEIAGSAAVIVGIFLIALFLKEGTSSAAAEEVAASRLLYILLPLALAETALVLFCLRLRVLITGYIIGFTAGTAMAFQTLAKRISTVPGFPVYGIIGVIVFAPLTLFITQVGFARSKANQVVPAFTAASIVVATVSGYLILGERLLPPQFAGIFLVAAGAVFMTAFRKTGQREHP